MPIRFPCPACRQPLEIDDTWAGQSVACPYCRRVVTAPQTNTWPTGGVPMASPAQPAGVPLPSPGFAPPPPPSGAGPYPSYAAGHSSAGWALALTILGSLATIGLFFAWMLLVYKTAMDTAGPHAPQAQIEQTMQELLAKGFIPHSQAMKTGALLATFATIGGVVIAARSLARRESGRGMAIAACIVGGLFLLCQMVLTMSLLGPRPPA